MGAPTPRNAHSQEKRKGVKDNPTETMIEEGVKGNLKPKCKCILSCNGSDNVIEQQEPELEIAPECRTEQGEDLRGEVNDTDSERNKEGRTVKNENGLKIESVSGESVSGGRKTETDQETMKERTEPKPNGKSGIERTEKT